MKQRWAAKGLRIAAAVSTVAVLAGCGGPIYHRGPMRPIHSRALEAPPFTIPGERPAHLPVRKGDGKGREARDGGPAALRNPAPLTWALPQNGTSTSKTVTATAGSPNMIVRVVAGKCSILLTRRNILDLNKAVPHSCTAEPDMRRIHAWRRDGDSIELIERGGRRAATLSKTGTGTYEGETGRGTKLKIHQSP